MRVSPFDNAADRFRAGRMGMWLLLLALGLLFASGLIGFLVIRLQLRRGWPELPPLPAGLWLSTLTLIVSSGSMQLAAIAARAGRAVSMRLAMIVTIALGVTFLGLQIMCWIQWLGELHNHWSPEEEFRFALAAFYVFTGMHAAHVVGGLVPMAIVTARNKPSRSTGSEALDKTLPAAGVEYCAMYWHFLDAVWLVLFLSLKLGA